MATSFLFSLIILSLLLPSSALQQPDTLRNAADILLDSGFQSMALTLQLISSTLVLNSSTATIFAPSDAAFIRSGQPSLLQLQYHISPLRLDPEELSSLPFASEIATLLFNHPLIITTPPYDSQLSINDVKTNDLPIHDDGSVIIYGVEEFFNSSFHIIQESAPEPSPPLPISTGASPPMQVPSEFNLNYFGSASDLLRSRGYSRMATFLDMQLGFANNIGLTIFAPPDEAIDAYVRNFSDFSSIFRRHVVHNWLQWGDLMKLDDGAVLFTFSEQFVINVARSGDILELNGLPVIFPEMYNSNFLAVHGISKLLVSSATPGLTGDSFFEFDKNEEQNPPDYGEY